MEMTTDESKRILRRIELEAYSALVTALRAQGELDREKKRLLRELGEQLSISTERHRAEIRRAISDDRLSMIAECVCGSDASVEWESEGRRIVPLMPRLVPQTAFTGTATAAANNAASVNSTITTSVRARTEEHGDDDMKSKKRQRTSSPKPVQKVIVSSIPKTTPKDSLSTANSTGRSINVTSKETPRLVKPSNISVKQENTNSSMSSVSMKINPTLHSGCSSHHQSPSKPIILGGSKQASSVSVATSSSKHVVPLPASCLQAHASVVSSNKNRSKLNLVKQKPKPKFKPLTATVKIVSSSHVSQVSSVSQSLQSTNKAFEVTTPVGKTIQMPRSSSSLTVSPRSSISLTTFKSVVQQKPKSQSPPVVLKTVEATSRRAPGQLTKTTSVSRLSRPLPAILPKAIPPKSLSSIATAGRKLASILPAPAKSTTSSNPVMLPVATNTSTTSSPIPIAPLPRPPQSFHGLASAVISKVPAVSLTTGPSAKRETREVSSASSTGPEVGVSFTAVSETTKVSSLNSSPLLSKSQESVDERETLSPVSDILSLVTSSSNVPFVSSSPMKSKSSTTVAALNEISLKCEEKLPKVKDFLKGEIRLKELSSLPGVSAASTAHFLVQGAKQQEADQNKANSAPNDALETVIDPGYNTVEPSQLSSVKVANTDLFQVEQSTLEVLQASQWSTKTIHGANELVDSGIDLSPLVNELLSSSFVVTKEKDMEKTVDISNPLSLDTVNPGNSCEAGQCANVGSAIDVPRNEQGNNLGEIPAVSQGKLDRQSGVYNVDNIGASVRNVDAVNQFTFIREHKGVDEINNMKNLTEETGATSQKVVVQMLDTFVPNDQELPRELLVTERENHGQLEQLSDLKEKEKATVDAKDIEKSDERNLLTDKNEGVVVSEIKAMDKPSPLGQLTGPEHAIFTGNEKVKQLDKTRSLEYKTNADALITTGESVENESSLLKEPEQPTASITKHHVGKHSENVILENKTEHLIVKTKTQQPVEDSLTTDGKESDQLSVKPIKNLPLLNEASKETKSENKPSFVLTTPAQSLCGSFLTESQDFDEQLSGSDPGSTEVALIRTSGRKRKAPPPRDFSLSAHPPGWIRGALLLLQKISRFRGNARAKGDPIAASWFAKPVEAVDAPGYHKLIKTPMDFGTIRLKLEVAEYTDHTQFHADMLLVKTNCYKYNPPGHDVRRDCEDVFQFYEAEYERFVGKLEKFHLSSAKKLRPLSSVSESK